MEKLSQPCPIFFTKRVGCNSRSRFEYASVVHRIQFPGNGEEALESFVLPRRSGTSVTSALPRGTFDKIFRNRVSVIILWLSSPASVYPTLATVINIVVLQSSNESRRGHVRFTYKSQYGGVREIGVSCMFDVKDVSTSLCEIHCFIRVLLLCEYWKRFGKGFLRSKYLEGFFFIFFPLKV